MYRKLRAWQKAPGRQKYYRKLASNILSATVAQTTSMVELPHKIAQ